MRPQRQYTFLTAKIPSLLPFPRCHRLLRNTVHLTSTMFISSSHSNSTMDEMPLQTNSNGINMFDYAKFSRSMINVRQHSVAHEICNLKPISFLGGKPRAHRPRISNFPPEIPAASSGTACRCEYESSSERRTPGHSAHSPDATACIAFTKTEEKASCLENSP